MDHRTDYLKLSRSCPCLGFVWGQPPNGQILYVLKKIIKKSEEIRKKSTKIKKIDKNQKKNLVHVFSSDYPLVRLKMVKDQEYWGKGLK